MSSLDLRKALPSTATAELPAVLLPYQQRWIADTSPLKVCEKGRRTGITWAEAADDVLIAASAKAAGGQNVFYIGYNQDMGLEFVEACAMWAKVFHYAAGEIEEGIWQDADPDKHIKTYTIRFPESGHRIVALSSRPANLRGKQGVVVLDEAAFHDDLGELIKSAMALLIWGGKVRIISTHNGEDNAFNELITEIRAKKRKGTVQRFTFREAVKDGLYERVCLRRGIDWDAEAEAAWVEDVYAFYGDDAEEELDAVPKSGSGAFLSGVLIERCMYDAPVLRLAYPNEFSLKPVDVRRYECAGWIEDNLVPRMEQLQEDLQHVYGFDCGRSGDLSVFAPLVMEQNLRRRAPFLLELRNVPFDQQEQILDYLVPMLPRFHAGKHDARGIGQQLAEHAADNFGHMRIEQVMLSQEWYRDNMPAFKQAFEDGLILIPRHADIRSDLRAIKVIKGVAKVPDDLRAKGSDGKQRHADSAVALVLAYAASQMDVEVFDYRPVPRNPRDSRQGRDHDHLSRPVRVTGGFRRGVL
ncbi:hypothetical protein [Desulfocurvibacter africanus]|uniref:hypothetical protein n=1 Tax=Desulfocurvibacter africanus TaxID=873 RepID=UPI00042147D9|nr:hypothetical protein [Desulfocurvibacter africanus]